MEKPDFIKNYIGKCGLSVSDEQAGQLLAYFEMLTDWNERMNLTAITDFEEVVVKHFADSLEVLFPEGENVSRETLKEKADEASVMKASPEDSGAELSAALGKFVSRETNIKLIDVGTGAGFPGIPLKILRPKWRVTLLDSLNKRIGFLDAVKEHLGLEKVETLHSRAEDAAANPAFREQYDLCVSRAVASLPVLLEYCLPFVKKGGWFVSYKSGAVDEELRSAAKALKGLGGSVKKVVRLSLPDTDISRSLIVIKKVETTPKKYPRKAGLPSKSPL